MPPSSNQPPRRSRPQSANSARPAPARSTSSRSSAPKPRSISNFEERTLDLTEPRRAAPKTPKSAPKPATDPGSKRRALKKKRTQQGNFLAWTVAAAVSVVIAGAAAGVWSEFQSAQGRVAQKRATLADLRAQLEIGKKRLGALASASGKERVLVENGFIKPGERLLLFPKNSSKPSSNNGG